MRGDTATRRREGAISRSVAAVCSGSSYRKSGAKYRIPKSTIWDRKHRTAQPTTRSRKFALSEDEEKIILQLILRFADRGIPMTRQHVREAASIVIQTFSSERKSRLPFTGDIPERKWVSGFYMRHKDFIKCGQPNYQEGKRFRATNAETLCNHYSALEALKMEYGFDSSRVWNLDETGCSPGKDTNGANRKKRFLRRTGTTDFKADEFVRSNRMTIMPCISASGDMAPLLFVFKGKNLPYREVLEHGHKQVQTYDDLLPRGSLIYMREEVGGVDSDAFLDWAKHFIIHVRDLTQNGRKVLLTFDGYRSHMSLRVLQLLHDNSVVVYALPAHTSGKTQPCDVQLFGAFKTRLNEVICEAADPFRISQFDTFDFCNFLRQSMDDTFTRQSIVSTFRKSGLWPIDPSRLLSTPRPKSAGNIETLFSVGELE